MLLIKLINFIIFLKIVLCKIKSYGIIIDYVQTCKNHKFPNRLENVTIEILSKVSFAINADLQIVKATKRLPALIRVFKCSSRADENCETYLRIPQKDFCPFITMKGQFWSVFYESVTPKMACPLKKGHYAIRNGSIDAKSFLTYLPPGIDIDDYYWKFRTQIYAYPEKGELFCVEGGGKLVVYRRH